MSAELTAAAGKLHDQMQQAVSSLREIGRHPRGMPLSGEAGSELAYLVARLAIELEALQRAQSPVDASGGQPPAGDAVRAPADELARQNPHADSIARMLTAHSEAIGALTDGLRALTAAIRAINGVMLDDRPRLRKWWHW